MQKQDHKVFAVSQVQGARSCFKGDIGRKLVKLDQKGGLKNCCILKNLSLEDNEFRLLEIINHTLMKRKVKTFRFLLDLKFTQGSIIK